MEFLKYFGLQLVAFTWSGSQSSLASSTRMETVSEPVADNDSHNSQDDNGSAGSNNEDQMITNKTASTAAATDRNIVEDLEQRVHELDCKLRQVRATS